jgi:flagellar basal-body rod protein FlgG
MIRALYTSATGMKAQELMMDNTANNLANVNTNGFKRSRIDFADLLYLTLQQPGTEISQGQPSPIGLQIGSGVRASGTTKLFAMGNLEQTGDPLHLAIEGEGFFQVTVPGLGTPRYTRDGAFHLDAQGNLVTADGYQLVPAVTIPEGANNLRIATDGTVSANVDGTETALGQLQIVTFPNPAGLSSEGSNLYAQTAASGTQVEGSPSQNGFGALRQNFLESSNVEVVTELISLIAAQRAYEINSRAIRAGDEMLSVTNEIAR